MTRPMTTIINVPTGEVIERELNDEEYEAFLRDKKIDEQRLVNEQAEKETVVVEE